MRGTRHAAWARAAAPPGTPPGRGLTSGSRSIHRCEMKLKKRKRKKSTDHPEPRIQMSDLKTCCELRIRVANFKARPHPGELGGRLLNCSLYSRVGGRRGPAFRGPPCFAGWKRERRGVTPQAARAAHQRKRGGSSADLASQRGFCRPQTPRPRGGGTNSLWLHTPLARRGSEGTRTGSAR